MSKIAKAIMARSTERVFLKKEPLSDFLKIDEGFGTYGPERHLVEYRIGVCLKAAVLVPEHDKKFLSDAIRNTKRDIIEAVFGEFRSDISSIRKHLYNHNVDLALQELNTLEEKMFSDE